ncbi:minor tail protein [Arthrobacter phage SerialPhiller]|nr:minor tail protein [Arthrobacter phage Kels]WNO27596.1 hypothetical protein SEA_ARIELAGOS_13 [Arthrobacter phage Arielagos]WNT45245.1 minor tail protein [Arthrobacter phage SerialPhiller]
MDLNGRFPKLLDGDSVYTVKEYSEKMSDALVAELGSIGEPWQKLTLLNGWVDYVGGGGYKTGLWARKVSDNVQISGMIKNGQTGVALAVLPPELRPPYAAMYPAIAAAASAGVVVNDTGNISYLFGPAAPAYLNMTLFIPLV